MLLLACTSAAGEGDETSAQAITGTVDLVPETAPSEAIVLANADGFAGINELHYVLLRGLFADPALDGVKVHYLTSIPFENIIAPTRSTDGDRLTARFSTRFAQQIRSGRLARVEAAVDTNWARDYFPLVVKRPDASKLAIRFDYQNEVAEGMKSASGPVAESVAKGLGLEVATSTLGVEGGNILVDEEETLFTTTKILERNKPKTKAAIETELKSLTGAKAIAWLEGLPGEATEHVDIMAKVVGRKKVVVSDHDGRCAPDAPDFCKQRKPALDKVAKAFEARGYQVTRILSAESDGDYRPLTYANSLVVNGSALIPAYFDPRVADDLAGLEGPGVPAKKIIKDCNTANPFPNTTDVAAESVARERARCAMDGVVKALDASGDTQTGNLYRYQLTIAARDAAAKAAYERLGYRVAPIPSIGMINFGGSIHCVTMQIAK